MTQLRNEGERFLPDRMEGAIALEHVHRYRFASQFVGGKDVLDIASGEGYGSACLADLARRVTGVDIAADAVQHAKHKYAGENLQFLVGNCAAIPLADRSIDVVVSFETIEHHDAHELMMQEIKRVLRPGGILVISSPDKREYSDKSPVRNPFHVKELYREEFEALLARHFRHVRLYGQRVLLGSALIGANAAGGIVFQDLNAEGDSAQAEGLPRPIYWVGVASSRRLPAASGGFLEHLSAGAVAETGSVSTVNMAEVLKLAALPDSAVLRASLTQAWYLGQNEDLVQAGVDPHQHWLNNGWKEGRLPSADSRALLIALLEEREKQFRTALAAGEGELQSLKRQSIETLQALEVESARVQREGRLELDAQVQRLVARELEFAAHLAEVHRGATEERIELTMALQRQLQELTEQHGQREAQLCELRDELEARLDAEAERAGELEKQLVHARQGAIEARMAQQEAARQQALLEEVGRAEREANSLELRRARQQAAETQRQLEAQLQQARLKARYEVEAQVRVLLERERAFAAQLSFLQEGTSREREVSARAQAQLEQALRSEIALKEDEIARLQLQANAAAMREKDQAGQLLEARNAASAERVAMRRAAQDQIEAILDRHRGVEADAWRLQRQAREELEAQLQALAGREREFARQLAFVHRKAGEEREALLKAAQDQLHAIAGESEKAQWNLQAEISRLEGEIRRVRDAAVAERASLQRTHEGELAALGGRLGAIEEAWTWRLGAPLRWFWGLFARPEGRRNPSRPAGPLRAGAATGADGAIPVPVTAATSLDELLAHDEERFITCAYLTLLGRAPDRDGHDYYLGRIGAGGEKAAIVCEICESAEFGRFKPHVAGLESRLRWWKLGRMPVVGIVFRALDRGTGSRGAAGRRSPIAPAVTLVAAPGGRSAENVPAPSSPAGNSLPTRVARPCAAFMPRAVGEPASTEAAAGRPSGFDIAAYLLEPVDPRLQDGEWPFTRLMHYIWMSRLDLQGAFDIRHPEGRLQYGLWFVTSASVEYGLTSRAYPRQLLDKCIALGGESARTARAMCETRGVPPAPQAQPADRLAEGANLVGYAFGEFGMGEHIRMVANALETAHMPYAIINQEAGQRGAADTGIGQWIVHAPRYLTNIFHINADVLPPLFFRFGEDFFAGRHNVGYWAWELPACPAQFDLALRMVDEVWAISDFVAESFKTRSPVPVMTMPLAVTVPDLDDTFTKAYFGLPQDRFLFLFTFDAASYLDRKNPIAVVHAFRAAFPTGGEGVHLLLKTMNVERAGPLWDELVREVRADPRITLRSDRLARTEVLGLTKACDAFVSLHRSEGFGRCVAEAMAYGKPVVVTNFSGTRDFAREGTACPVEFRLVAVPSGAYPFWEGQVWAEPDVEHAASLMRRLVEDGPYRESIAAAGRRFVLENFNADVIGARYARRLAEIARMRQEDAPDGAPSSSPSGAPHEDEMAGHVDLPTPRQCDCISGAFPVEGWAASVPGIERVEIYVDDMPAGNAHHGVLRPDIQAAFPHFRDAPRSGFCHVVDTSALAHGAHVLRVVAHSRDGRSIEWTLSFVLEETGTYQQWVDNVEPARAREPEPTLPAKASRLTLVMRVRRETDGDRVLRTATSLAAQGHGAFELVVVADRSARGLVRRILGEAGLEGRFRIVLPSGTEGLEAALEGGGDFVGTLDAGDTLRPWSLERFATEIASHPEVDLHYADEDRWRGGLRASPLFKPAWSPVYLESFNYIGRPWFARRRALSVALAADGASGNGHYEHRLLQAVGRGSAAVCHIPEVLLTRGEGANAATPPAPVPRDPGAGAKSGFAATKPMPRVSIIIPTMLGDMALVERCFDGLVNRTGYPDVEVIVVTNNLADEDRAREFLRHWPFTFVAWDGPFSWSAINNFGAARASGDYLLFLNDDVEPLGEAWLATLVGRMRACDAGAVGPLLRYPNGTIQHLGINFVDYGGGARHAFRFCFGREPALDWLTGHAREVSAVTGACLLTDSSRFAELGGFDESFPLVCNDTDYCIRLWRQGYPVVVEPAAQLIHHEGISRSRMPEVDDVRVFWERWGELLREGDRFTNPNLDNTRDDWMVNPAARPRYGARVVANTRWSAAIPPQAQGRESSGAGPAAVGSASSPAGRERRFRGMDASGHSGEDR